jgi:hypothetical protein
VTYDGEVLYPAYLLDPVPLPTRLNERIGMEKSPMTDNNWQAVYDEAVDTFGTTPGGALEAQLLDAWRDRPMQTVKLLQRIATSYRDGKIHSPWGIVKRELSNDEQRAQIVGHGSTAGRTKAVALAERYVRLAGHHLDEEELVREIFGSPHERGGKPGHLAPWGDDLALRAHITSVWRESCFEIPRLCAACAAGWHHRCEGCDCSWQSHGTPSDQAQYTPTP